MDIRTRTQPVDGAAQTKPVTITINGRSVTMPDHKATGAEIKAAAIAQGVPIQPDFSLFEVKGQGQLKPVGDADTVTLHDKSEFRAVAPDDNS
ncbi:MAG: multiubiquitin domain-containing protein [Ardenticatenaceae bacterium]|nr:multiubiquitin domain-containing protein [Ardenticatenaceae bacterium]